MMPFLVVDRVVGTVEETVVNFVDFLPSLIAAVLVLGVGYVLGQWLGEATTRIARRTDLDGWLADSPLGRVIDGSDAVASGLGTLVHGYVLLFAAFVAADQVGFPGLRGWIDAAIELVPAVVAGLAIIVLGIVLADVVGDVIRTSPTARETGYPNALAAITTAFVYLVVVATGLETMGFDLTILYILVENFALAFGVATALALGLAFGLAFGLGSREYVSENIADWTADVGEAESADD